jgi:hypothetical protein
MVGDTGMVFSNKGTKDKPEAGDFVGQRKKNGDIVILKK